MGRWFRYHDEALNDAKVQRLSGDLFKCWVNLLCLASQRGGDLGSIADVAFALRVNETRAASIVTELVMVELLDRVEGGYFAPHNWDGRQYKSDTSNDRVAAHRERKRNAAGNDDCNVTVTADETELKRPQNTETETDLEKKESRAVAKATRPVLDEAFERFWDKRPRRDGADPKAPAQKKFLAKCRSGADPEAIIAGIGRYAEECRAKGIVGTCYVVQAMTWLNQDRWGDYPAPKLVPPDPNAPPEPECPTWSPLKTKLRALLGDEAVTAWLSRVTAEREAGALRLVVSTKFTKSWIERNYLDRIAGVARAGDPTIERVEVAVGGRA